jgi:S-adenosylmethionine decarboxylase
MPGKSLSGDHRPLHQARLRPPGPARQRGDLPAQPPAPPQAPPTAGKVLYAMDAVLTAASPVTDIRQLTALTRSAVRAGHGHVLESSHVIFPNGAVTLVLILAESHLSIHTWPEEDLIAIDLFSCGAIAGQRVLAELARLLQLDDVRIRQLDRGQGQGRGQA